MPPSGVRTRLTLGPAAALKQANVRIVKNGFIDVDGWTRPGIGLDFKVEAARAHLRVEDADFFD